MVLLFSIDELPFNLANPIRPALGVEAVIADFMLLAVSFEAFAPDEGGQSNDGQIQPAQHTGLGAVSHLVAQGDRIALMGRAEKDVFPQGHAASAVAIVIMIVLLLGFGDDFYKTSQQHLRETPNPPE